MTSLQYFGNIMLQISPNSNKLDIFELYTERAVENVQDGISRPLESQEIQKKTTGTVLVDTL